MIIHRHGAPRAADESAGRSPAKLTETRANQPIADIGLIPCADHNDLVITANTKKIPPTNTTMVEACINDTGAVHVLPAAVRARPITGMVAMPRNRPKTFRGGIAPQIAYASRMSPPTAGE